MQLPLRWLTPDGWAAGALADPLELLADHVYLERKAASNALELLNRWSARQAPDHWVATLSAIARDETDHLLRVSRLLAKRGGRLPRTHRNPYASDLHRLVRRGQGLLELLDRLLVSALIEARSCERFGLLRIHCSDAELARLYERLWSSELGHFQSFLRLAQDTHDARQIGRRWAELLDLEADIIRSQPPGPRMHSGVARSA